MLPSDPNGFLTGTVSESLEKIAREIEILKAIHADTSATLTQLSMIANALAGTHAPTPPAVPPNGPPVPLPPPVIPPAAPPSGPPTPGAPPGPGPSPDQAGPSDTPTPPVPVPPGTPPDNGRDANGRWRRRNPVPPGPDGLPVPDADTPPDNADGKDGKNAHAMEDAADTLKGVASAVATSADGMDPTVQAVKELGGMFAPVVGILKPMGRLFGIGRKTPEQKNQRESVSWYRRIWSAVKDKNGAGGGGMGLIMTAVLSALGFLLGPIKALSGLTGLTGVLKGVKSVFSAGSGGMVKGLLKKIPIIGALIGGGMAISDMLAPDDPNLSPEENKKNRYSNVGGDIGGVVGGALGLFGGPAGAVAGAMIGDFLGKQVGEWLSTVDLASIPGKISEAFTNLEESVLKVATSALDSVKDAWNKAADVVLGIKDNIADKVQTAKDYVGDKATSVKDSSQNLLSKVTGGRLGSEGSDGRKAELIKAMDAGGITDQKSKAMLMANVDTETGGFKKNEENLNYSAKRLQEVFPKYYKTPEDARADAGNPEAIANKVYGGRMGNTEAGDGFKFRGRGDLQLTGKDQYADMGKKLGVDLVNNPDLAMDPKISAQIAVAHWKSSGADKAAQTGDITRARKLTNGGTNGLADVTSKYDGYLAQAKAGDLTPTRRADEGKVLAPAAAGTALSNTMSMVKGAPAVGVMPVNPMSPFAPAMPGANTVGVMAPSAPTMGMASIKPINAGNMAAPSYTPPAPDASQTKIPATPAVERPLMSPNKAAASTTIQMSVPLSQNIEDRQIAHVASGGMGMA